MIATIVVVAIIIGHIGSILPREPAAGPDHLHFGILPLPVDISNVETGQGLYILLALLQARGAYASQERGHSGPVVPVRGREAQAWQATRGT